MPDRRMAILGAPNFGVAGYTSAEAGHGVALPTGMEATNLLTDEPSERCRIPVLTRANARFSFYFDSPITKTVAGFALINVNLSRFGRYRLVANANGGSFPADKEIIVPDAKLESGNITGAVTNVDESAHAPDGLWVTPTSTTTGGAWAVRYSFPTPSLGAPAPGAHRQAFELWVRLAGTLTGITTRPLIRVSLWESGSEKLVLGSRVITETAGQLLIFPWDATVLTTASGANVEIKIEHGGGAGLGGSYVELGTVNWFCEFASFTQDTGWLSSPFSGSSSLWGGTYADEVGPEPMSTLVYIPAAAWTGISQWQWMWSDDQTFDGATYPTNYPLASVIPPSGYAQAGVSVAGPVFVPSVVNFAHGPLVAVRDPSPSGYTLGGQETGSRRNSRRVMPTTLTQVTDGEGYDLFDRLDWRKGKKLPVLVVRFPDAAAATQRHTTLWATLEDMPGLGKPKALGRLSWSGVFVEKL